MIPIPPDQPRNGYMTSWFLLGESPDGLDELRAYLYTHAARELSPSGLMVSLQAARDAMRERDAKIEALQSELNEERQGKPFAMAGGAS